MFPGGNMLSGETITPLMVSRSRRAPRAVRAFLGVLVVSSTVGASFAPVAVRADEVVVENPTAPSAGAETGYIVELAPLIPDRGFNPDNPNAVGVAVAAAADAVAAVVESSGGEVVHEYTTGPFVAVSTDDPDALLDEPGVVAVRPEQVAYRSLAVSLDVVNATDADLDAARNGQAADGAGYAVAIIDDGIDRTHPMFMNGASSRVVLEACFTWGECYYGTGNMSSREGVGAAAHQSYVVNGVTYYDWHGTHVAGIAAGDSRGTQPIVPRGVAKAANIVAAQVFGSSGSTSGSKIDAALEWVRAKKIAGTPIAAVNMSLGGSSSYPGACDSVSPSTKAAVDALNAVGVVVVVASGNSGWTGGMSWPACMSNVVPVGATDDFDVVTSFSNISATSCVVNALVEATPISGPA